MNRWHPTDGNMIAADDHFNRPEIELVECDRCDGGRRDDGSKCPICAGAGEVEAEPEEQGGEE